MKAETKKGNKIKKDKDERKKTVKENEIENKRKLDSKQ
jgi:hypothetical protein